MLKEIVEFSKKGLRIGVYPIMEGKKHLWVACIRIGDSNRLSWVSGDCESRSTFISPEEAYNAAINFCNSYKPSAKIKEVK